MQHKLLLSVCLMTTLSSASHAFLVNGSFETGQAYSGGTPNIFAAGTPSPWYATSFTPDMYDNTGVDGWGIAGVPLYDNMFSGVTACHGNRFIGFAASTSFSGINEAFAQTVTGLVVGQRYTIEACMITDISANIPQYGGPYNGYGHVNAYLNGNLVGTFSQNTLAKTWELRSFSFTAQTTSGVFEFIAQLDNSSPGLLNSYMGLDGIQVVPEPGTFSALGVASAWLLRRKKRTS